VPLLSFALFFLFFKHLDAEQYFETLVAFALCLLVSEKDSVCFCST
jgi:hypothetical protein